MSKTKNIFKSLDIYKLLSKKLMSIVYENDHWKHYLFFKIISDFIVSHISVWHNL